MRDLKLRLDKAVATRDYLKSSIREKRLKVQSIQSDVEVMEKARYVLSEVAKLTQEKVQGYIESLVSTAIRSVFDRPFEFKMKFERKRNKMECRPVVIENGQEYDPENDMGGSIIDIVSFALRVVLWGMQKPRSRNVLVVDEPMKNLGSLVSLGGEMLREISHKLGLQLIVITHEPALADIADRTYTVERVAEHSEVKMLE